MIPDSTREFVKKAHQVSAGMQALIDGGMVHSPSSPLNDLVRKYAKLAEIASNLVAEIDVMIERNGAVVDTLNRALTERNEARARLAAVREAAGREEL